MESIMPPAAAPVSPLARYRLLSPTSGIRVSPLVLGTMNFGSNWKHYMGECSQETAFEIMDYYYSQGGNFIDTANNYQYNQAEQWIGAWLSKRGVRDQIVLATKFSINFRATKGEPGEIQINFQGNNAKSLRTSVANSLKALQTDYLDILYVHWTDFATPIPELMQNLNQLVAAGKVLYLGVSDTPAWVVSKANEYARNHDLKQFTVFQGNWNAGKRDFEREIIPMAGAEGMAILPFGVLGSGKFKSAEARAKAEAGGRAGTFTEAEIKISDAMERVGNKKGATVTAIAQAYVMHKAPYVFPVVGGRNVEQLKGNIEALKVSLDEADIAEIEDAAEFDLGFPMNYCYGPKAPRNLANVWPLGMGGATDYVEPGMPIRPQQ